MKKYQNFKNPFWYQDSVDFRVVTGYFYDRKSRPTGKHISKNYVHRFWLIRKNSTKCSIWPLWKNLTFDFCLYQNRFLTFWCFCSNLYCWVCQKFGKKLLEGVTDFWFSNFEISASFWTKNYYHGTNIREDRPKWKFWRENPYFAKNPEMDRWGL